MSSIWPTPQSHLLRPAPKPQSGTQCYSPDLRPAEAKHTYFISACRVILSALLLLCSRTSAHFGLFYLALTFASLVLSLAFCCLHTITRKTEFGLTG